MSNAPPDSSENASARVSSPNRPSLTVIGLSAAWAFRIDSSDVTLCGLIVASMRCISAMTAPMASSASARSWANSSTSIEVPMMASSRRYQPAPIDPGTDVGGALAMAGEWRLVMDVSPDLAWSREP